jgi:CelD/BcsL family acetyltransferase involved in cellulose biosynthesis
MLRGMLDFVCLLHSTGASASKPVRARRNLLAIFKKNRSAAHLRDNPAPIPLADACNVARYQLQLHRAPEAIAQEWRAFEVTAVGTAFQSFMWISAWCRNVASSFGEEPLIVSGRDEHGELAFILPFAIVQRLGTKMLTWLGQTHSGYGFGLYRRDVVKTLDADAVRQILWHIAAQYPGLAAVHFIKQPLDWDGVRNPFAAIQAQPCSVEVSAFDLKPDFQALYSATISSKRRADQRRVLNQLRRTADVVIDIAANAEERVAMYAAFRAQKTRQLAQRRQDNCFADPAIDAFYRDILRHEDEHAPIELSFMRVGDEIAAVDIVMHFQRRTYGLNRSIADGELRRYAPGRHVNCFSVERACALGSRTYDLGPGVAAYKDEWKGYPIPLFTTSSPLHAKGLPAAALILAVARGEALLKRYPHIRHAVREVHHRLRRVR